MVATVSPVAASFSFTTPKPPEMTRRLSGLNISVAEGPAPISRERHGIRSGGAPPRT